MLAVTIWAKAAGALEIRVPPLTVKAGQSIEIPIIVDEVDNLAGVKLVLTYDPEMLTYKKGAKTKETDSLMHIVNDKKPGILILVMAGARGVKGKDLPIFTLTFDVKKGLQQNQSTKISITELQLMGDDLKEQKCTIVTHPVTVTP
jgi:hypothetical protein